MISVIPCWIISIGLILCGIGLFIAVSDDNKINVLISVGVILIVIGFVWDILSGNMSETHNSIN